MLRKHACLVGYLPRSLGIASATALQKPGQNVSLKMVFPLQATDYAWKTQSAVFDRTSLVLVRLLVLLLVLLPGLLCLLPVAVVTRLVRLSELVLVLGTGILDVLTVARGDAISVSISGGQDRRRLVSVALVVTALVVVLRGRSRAVLITIAVV